MYKVKENNNIAASVCSPHLSHSLLREHTRTKPDYGDLHSHRYRNLFHCIIKICYCCTYINQFLTNSNQKCPSGSWGALPHIMRFMKHPMYIRKFESWLRQFSRNVHATLHPRWVSGMHQTIFYSFLTPLLRFRPFLFFCSVEHRKTNLHDYKKWKAEGIQYSNVG